MPIELYFAEFHFEKAFGFSGGFFMIVSFFIMMIMIVIRLMYCNYILSTWGGSIMHGVVLFM